MNLDLFWRYAPSLLSGFGVTILCWAAGGALGLILGFAITLLRRLRIPPLNWLIRAFIEMFRGTPFLVQLFLLYAGGPSIGLRLSATAPASWASGSTRRRISPRSFAPASRPCRSARSKRRSASACRRSIR